MAESGPAAINDRIAQLEREWTAGRMTKAVIGVFVLAGFPLATYVSPWFVAMPAVGGLLLAQYLFARTSWLGRLFCRMGCRSGCEIEHEKFALMALRGDFRGLPTVHDIQDDDSISRLEGEGGIVIEPDESKMNPREAAQRGMAVTHR